MAFRCRRNAHIFRILLSIVAANSIFVSFVFSTPVFDRVRVLNETLLTDKTNHTYLKTYVRFEGANFEDDMRMRITDEKGTAGRLCFDHGYSTNSIVVDRETHPNDNDDDELTREWSNSTISIMSIVYKIYEIPSSSVEVWLCVSKTDDDGRSSSVWEHIGKSVTFRTKLWWDSTMATNSIPIEIPPRKRIRRDGADSAGGTQSSSSGSSKQISRMQLYGIRLESSTPSAMYEDDDSAEPTLLVHSDAKYRLFGSGWTKDTLFVWTAFAGEPGSVCEYIAGEKRKIDGDVYENQTTVTLQMKIPPSDEHTLYLCAREPDDKMFYHLGRETFTRVKIRNRYLPLWTQIVIIVTCLSFSSLFSGLNLGLLSLNQTDLKIIANTGTETERRYARTISPVREKGNYLLCSILLGNVMVNSVFTILLDDLTSGMVAIIGSTLAIVIIGEICPQAICSRHGLCIGAKTIYVTRIIMVLTAPLSWPLSQLLDYILGEELATTYTRERLKELVNISTDYNDLEKEEINIISGALELRKKTVGEIMTKIEDVYMLSHDTILDFETVTEIMKSGFSRIPVYEGTRKNIVSLLYTKDLALIDPDDNRPLKTIAQFYHNQCHNVFDDTTLDSMFKHFKEGDKGHMAFVQRVNSEGEGDPFYEIVGIVTMEDVLEELIQAEIMDETDVYTDNRSKKRRRMPRNQNLSMFAERSENQRVHISPQLNLAAYQFLSTSVDPFKAENISETVLLRLLKFHDIFFHIKMKDKEKMKDDPSCIIFQQGKPADSFALILEGRVEVTVGRENLVFESGPFTHFGLQAILPNVGVAESPTNVAQQMGSLQSVNLESILRNTFVPDYTVRAVTEVYYLRIKRHLYLAAKKATLLERSKKVSNAGEQFDDEVEKLLHTFEKNGSGDDDAKSQVSHEGSFSNPANLQYIEDDGCVNATASAMQERANNGFVVASTVSPSRTPHTTDHIEEKTTLLGARSAGQDDNRTVYNS